MNRGYKKISRIIDELIPDSELLEMDFLPDKIDIGDRVDFGVYGNLFVIDKTKDGHAWVADNISQPGCWLIDLKLACYIDKKGAVSQEQIVEINEDLAERAHELWLEREKAKGNTDNPNMVSYDELTEEDKESDRDYSREFLDTLDEEGYEIKEKEARNISAQIKTAVIVKEKGEWCVKSPDNSDWDGGCYDTEGKAEKRLKEIEYFKHKGNQEKKVCPKCGDFMLGDWLCESCGYTE